MKFKVAMNRDRMTKAEDDPMILRDCSSKQRNLEGRELIPRGELFVLSVEPPRLCDGR
jgi:hypothetical protein